MATRIVQNLVIKSRLPVLLMSSKNRVNVIGSQLHFARFSSSEQGDQKNTQEDVKKSVFISQSFDIFTNLALEDWIYKNYDFSNHHILMLWQNDPCVVIGRHQNPFSESNIANLRQAGIEFARRNSGGGAVFHDRGNLNCSFFTPRDRYDRKYNLNLISRAIYREYGIDTEISDRDDILLRGKKISGTAAKLGHPNAYHHCTLLVNSNKLHLSQALNKDETEIISKATSSVRSPIKNLGDVNNRVTVQGLITAIGYEFLRTPADKLTDGGRDHVMQQRGFQLINPTEKWFPGLNALKENFQSWDWRFGKTPKFSVQKNIQLKSGDQIHEFKLQVDVEKGLIHCINLVSLKNANDTIPIVSTLVGKPYDENNFNGIMNALKGVSSENVKQAMGL
jgi:lipoyltransferase 1